MIRKWWIKICSVLAVACLGIACLGAAFSANAPISAAAASHSSGWHTTGAIYNSEVKTGNVIDMRKQSYYEASPYEGSDLWVASGSNGQATSRNGGGAQWYKRYADGTNYFGYSVILPSDATCFYVDGAFTALNGRVYIGCNLKEGGISQNGVHNAFENVWYFDIGTEKVTWRTIDVLQLFPKDEVKAVGNQYYILMTGMPDTTTYGAQVVERMRFIHDGTIYTVEDTTVPEIAVTERVGFTSDANGVNDGAYVIDGYTADRETELLYGRMWRKLDSFTSTAVTKYSVNGRYAVYKFNFAGVSKENYVFKKLILNLDALGEYRVAVATKTSLGGEYNSDKLLNTENNAYWTDIACGSPALSEGIRSLDITEFADDVVYLRISDATDNTGGGCRVGGIELISYYGSTLAPSVSAKSNLTCFVDYPVCLDEMFTGSAAIEGYGVTLSYTVRDSSGQKIALVGDKNTFVPTAAGEYTVTVKGTDGNKNTASETFKITAKEPTGATATIVSDGTAKCNYGVPIDRAGLFLKLQSGQDAVSIPLALCTLDKPTLTKLGKQTVTASYGSYSATFEAECSDIVDKIVAVALPDELSYAGGTLDLSGGILSVVYASGAKKTVPMTADGVTVADGFDSVTAGSKPLTLCYDGGSCTFDIQLKEDVAVRLDVTTLPTKTSYQKGELLDLTGGELKITYESGKTKTIALNTSAVCVGGYSSAGGKQTLTVTYLGLKTTFSIGSNNGGSGCQSSISSNTWCLVMTMITLGLTAIYVDKKKRVTRK